MGRPLNKKYFGNRNIGTNGTTDNGIGGEGVASVTIAGEFSGFTGATTTVTFSAPQLPGGVTATGTAVIDGSGNVTGVTITQKGSGYTSAPTVTIADSDVGSEVTTGTATAVLTTDSGAVGSSTNQENAILISAYVPTANGGSSAVSGDIVKQVGSRRFKVKTAQGTGLVKLVATAPAAGQARITATDSAGGTYYVTKLTAHKALVTRGTGTQFATGASVKWTFGSAVANNSVTISNA